MNGNISLEWSLGNGRRTQSYSTYSSEPGNKRVLNIATSQYIKFPSNHTSDPQGAMKYRVKDAS